MAGNRASLEKVSGAQSQKLREPSLARSMCSTSILMNDLSLFKELINEARLPPRDSTPAIPGPKTQPQLRSCPVEPSPSPNLRPNLEA